MQLLKGFKSEYIEGIEKLKKLFNDNITLLEESRQQFNANEERLMQKLDNQPIEFNYDINKQLDAINEELKNAISAYLDNTSE